MFSRTLLRVRLTAGLAQSRSYAAKGPEVLIPSPRPSEGCILTVALDLDETLVHSRETEDTPKGNGQLVCEGDSTIDELLKVSNDCCFGAISRAINFTALDAIKRTLIEAEIHTAADLRKKSLKDHLSYLTTSMREAKGMRDLQNTASLYNELLYVGFQRFPRPKQDTCYELDDMAGFIRPGAKELLQRLRALPVEIVLFTAGIQSYADEVLNYLDDIGSFHHRLYRPAVEQGGGKKDLRLLGTDLRRTLLVDNEHHALAFQPRNGYKVKHFLGRHQPYPRLGAAVNTDELEAKELSNVADFVENMVQRIQASTNVSSFDVRDFLETREQQRRAQLWRSPERIDEMSMFYTEHYAESYDRFPGFALHRQGPSVGLGLWEGW